MEINATAEQKEILKGLNASVRFSETTMPHGHDDPMIPEERQPKPRRVSDKLVECRVIDKILNKPICSGYGPDEPAAFNEAVAIAKTAEKPQTPGQLAQQNIELKAELAALKAGIAPVKAVTSADLIAELEKRKLHIPDGHRRTKAWREEVQKLIEDHDEMEADMEELDDAEVPALSI